MSLSMGCSSISSTEAPARAASMAAATPATPAPTTTTGTWRSGRGALPVTDRASIWRTSVPRRLAGQLGDSRVRGQPSEPFAPVGRRVGESVERQRREIGEQTASVHDELADATAYGGRQTESHARHGGDDYVVRI